MSDYILSPFAQRDLRQIQRYYLKEAGEHIAWRMIVEFVAAFRALAQTLGMGHRRPDLAEDHLL